MSHPALDHIEKTLADAYRKEIDQEENIWRSLPFFAATLALQLAVVVQIGQRVADLPSARWWGSLLLLTGAGLLSVAALAFLARSIFPARFRYLAPETELLGYARDLIQDESQPGAEPALAALRSTLAEQYAVATQHNRRINSHRQWCRSIAGLLTLCSVLATLAVAALALSP